MIAPAPSQGRLGYLSAEAQWTRGAVIEVGTAAARLLIADRRPAHAIPLWDNRAPAPSALHGYQLRTVSDEASGLDVTRGGQGGEGAGRWREVARVVARLAARAEEVECREIHVVCELGPEAASGERLDAAQAVAGAVGRPVHVLTPRRASELLALGAAEELEEAGEEVLVRCGELATEVVLTRGRRRRGGASLPVGVEGLSARHSDPPREPEVKVLRHRVRSTLGALGVLPGADPEGLVVMGEVARLLPALAGVKKRDEVTLEGVRRALRTLQATHSARLARSTRLERDALRRLPGAALILEALMEHYGVEVCRLTSRGVRHGVLVAAAEDPEHWWVDLEAARLRRERLELPVMTREVVPGLLGERVPQRTNAST